MRRFITVLYTTDLNSLLFPTLHHNHSMCTHSLLQHDDDDASSKDDTGGDDCDDDNDGDDDG